MKKLMVKIILGVTFITLVITNMAQGQDPIEFPGGGGGGGSTPTGQCYIDYVNWEC